MKLLCKCIIGGIVAISILFFVLTYIPIPIGNGINDYSYDLPGNYELWKINSFNYRVVCKNNNYDYKNISSVLEVAYNDDFILVKVGYFDADENGFVVDSTVQGYYIIDVSKEEKLGTYENESQFNDEIDRLGVGDVCDWISANNLSKLL